MLLRAKGLDHCTQLRLDISQIFIVSFQAFGMLCVGLNFPSDIHITSQHKALWKTATKSLFQILTEKCHET